MRPHHEARLSAQLPSSQAQPTPKNRSQAAGERVQQELHAATRSDLLGLVVHRSPHPQLPVMGRSARQNQRDVRREAPPPQTQSRRGTLVDPEANRRRDAGAHLTAIGRLRFGGAHGESQRQEMTDEKRETPPDPTVVAGLLQQRHGLEGHDVSVDIKRADAGPTIEVAVAREGSRYRASERYELTLIHEDQAGSWDALVDAADALTGQLVESGWDYRSLPRGAGVEFQQGSFQVTVEYRRPEIDQMADELLRGGLN